MLQSWMDGVCGGDLNLATGREGRVLHPLVGTVWEQAGWDRTGFSGTIREHLGTKSGGYPQDTHS